MLKLGDDASCDRLLWLCPAHVPPTIGKIVQLSGPTIKYHARLQAMLKRRAPGPFDDRVGPTVLGVMLIIAIVSSFSIKLYVYAS